MLGLECESNEAWIASAVGQPAEVLIDHAHCEKKAATMALSLLNRYPNRRELVEQMAALAEEEMGHFRMVLSKIYERGHQFRGDPGDFYAQQLHRHIDKQEPARLLDTLLVCSLIEARSCERFLILSKSNVDADLRIFYRSLLESEARHRGTFLGLARLYFAGERVRTRLQELEVIEAAIVDRLPNAPVMHG